MTVAMDPIRIKELNTDNEFDVIIIGAGINGAGVARDAAMRGLKVLLLDKDDLSAGTTSWSTRLIHGGLRYLEHGELSLVRESLRERQTLMQIASHLVLPLAFQIPIYENHRRGPWTIRAGMILYDLLSFDKKLTRHRWLSRSDTLRQLPGLNPTNLLGSVIYYDGQVEFVERLTLENVLSARQHGAVVRTYSRIGGLRRRQGMIGVTIHDVLSDEHWDELAPVVINASGPWVDEFLNLAEIKSSRLIGGTKGSHLVVPPFRGAPRTAVYVEAQRDQRPIFIIPWNQKYLIGTTDIRFDGSLDRVEISEQETAYLLEETNRLIPEAQLTTESILFTYSGVRPLPFTRHKKEKSITRRHFVHEHPELPGLISLVGGKITTYRSLAEETVDLCFRRMQRTQARCLTASRNLPGAPNMTRRELKSRSAEASERLFRIYGTRASEILQLANRDRELLEPFDSETGALAAEIVYSFENELARTLTDCLMRRTMVGLNSSCGLTAVSAAASIGRKHLGWSAEHAQREVQNYLDYVQRFHPKAARLAPNWDRERP